MFLDTTLQTPEDEITCTKIFYISTFAKWAPRLWWKGLLIEDESWVYVLLRVGALLYTNRSIVKKFYILLQKPGPRPGQAGAKPGLTALAWPGIWESQSHLRPSQSRGFQAKPGRNSTIYDLQCSPWFGPILFQYFMMMLLTFLDLKSRM